MSAEEPQTRYLRVNSKYRDTSAVPHSNSDFYYSFINRYADRVTDIALVTAHFERLFGNMYAPISTLDYTVGAAPFSFTVTQGQYDAVQLAAELNTSADWSVVYNATTHRFDFTNTGIADLILLVTSPIANYIGLTEDLTIVPAATGSTQNVPTLGGPSQVYIQSSFLAQTNCLDVPELSNYIPYVQTVDISAVPYGFSCHFLTPQIEMNNIHFTEKVSLRQVDISVCDQYGNKLPFPDNSFVDLTFRMIYAKD